MKMLSLILKNLTGKPVTKMYPVIKDTPFERTRGRIYMDDTNCIYCSLCQRKCPADAITVDRPNTTWELNSLRCIICGECVTACPKKCIEMTNERRSVSSTKKIITLKKEQ